MIGCRAPDGTYIWMEPDRSIHAYGPNGFRWAERMRVPHVLPDYVAKAAYETREAMQGRAVIAEPLDTMRSIQSFGEMIDVVRRLCEVDGVGEPETHIEVPADFITGEGSKS